MLPSCELGQNCFGIRMLRLVITIRSINKGPLNKGCRQIKSEMKFGRKCIYHCINKLTIYTYHSFCISFKYRWIQRENLSLKVAFHIKYTWYNRNASEKWQSKFPCCDTGLEFREFVYFHEKIQVGSYYQSPILLSWVILTLISYTFAFAACA